MGGGGSALPGLRRRGTVGYQKGGAGGVLGGRNKEEDETEGESRHAKMEVDVATSKAAKRAKRPKWEEIIAAEPGAKTPRRERPCKFTALPLRRRHRASDDATSI